MLQTVGVEKVGWAIQESTIQKAYASLSSNQWLFEGKWLESHGLV